MQTELDKRLQFDLFRGIFAGLLVKKGVCLCQVQNLLGDSSLEIIEMYAHLRNDEMHKVVR